MVPDFFVLDISPVEMGIPQASFTQGSSIARVLNSVADLLSRRASKKSSHCHMWFSCTAKDGTIGMDA